MSKFSARIIVSTVVLIGLTTSAIGQSYSDTQRQYQEQARERQERQREEQKRRDQERDHEFLMQDRERDRNRYAPQPSGGGSSSTAFDLAVVAAAIAAATAILSAREPRQVDEARAFRALTDRRKWHVMDSCKSNARTQAIAMMKSRPEQADRFWIHADTVCSCFASRAVATLTEQELGQLLPYGAGTTWARLPTARVLDALLPCGIKSAPNDLLDVQQLASVQAR